MLLVWQIDVLNDGRPEKSFDVPADEIGPDEVRELIRLIAAKGLTPTELAGCFWSKDYRKLGLLDIQDYDEGRILSCGDGIWSATARRMMRAPT